MTYELYGQRFELHFKNDSIESLLNQYQTKKKATIHIYLNWMPFDAFILAMINTKEGISYAINYETKDVYLRTQSKTFDHELIIKGLSHVIRALAYPLHLIPLKQDIFYKDHIIYIGYTHLLKDIETYTRLENAMLAKHKKTIALFPDILSGQTHASYYKVKEIHILDDMPFPIDPIEAMRYVMPYLEIPRKAHDLKAFQETLKHIKLVPKKMI